MADFDAEQLTKLGRVSEVVPSPDGSWAAVEVQRLDAQGTRYVSDLWSVSLERGARPPRQLTRGDCRDRSPRFRRDGSLGFLSNRNPRAGEPEPGDTERAQVWLLPSGGGEPRPLTDEPLGVTDFDFASAGDRLVVIAPVLPGVAHEQQRSQQKDWDEHGPTALHHRDMPVRHWDHWIGRAAPHVIAYDEQGRGRTDLTPEADFAHRDCEWDLSPEGTQVVVTRQVVAEDQIPDRYLRVLDTLTGDTRELGVEPRVAHTRPRFSPDGARVACARERRFSDACPTVELYLLEVSSGHGRVVGKKQDPWDRWPYPEAWTTGGASILVTADDDGLVSVFRVHASSGEVTRITARQAGGSHAALRAVPGTNALVGIRSRITHPPEPCRVEIAEDAQPELLTRLSGFDPNRAESLAQVESIRVLSAEGTPVQSFLVRPRARQQPAPLLLWIHGGPISQFSDSWHWRWNPLIPASAGYAVALPNPRGSTGFGQDFIAGIWGNTWGGACYEDLLHVTEALLARDDIDGDRAAAMGGSFGGYMANWMGGQTDRFRALVTHASLFDLSAFYGTTDLPGWFALELAGDPHTDPKQFERYSPHRFVRNWKTPTLILHGEKDYRVPVSEALALFQALRSRDVPAEFVVFPDENHWIMRPRNIQAWYEAVLDFLGRHLNRDAPPLNRHLT